MAGNLLQVSSDNKLQISSDSKIVVAGASDPCCCGGTPCSYCDTGTTPASIPVLVEDVTICTGSCAVNDQFSGSSATIVADVNGSYDVPQTATPCVYLLQIGTVNFFSGNETCSGSPTHVSPIYLRVEFTSAAILVTIISSASFGGGYSMDAIFFNASYSIASPRDCSAQQVISDDQYVCQASTSAVALGGTVTLFP